MNRTLATLVYRTAALLRGEKTFAYLRDYERNPFRDLGAVQVWQEAEIAALLEYACEHVPFYREFRETPFAQFPLIDKKMLKAGGNSFLSEQRETLGRLTTKVTSGSTSEPLKIVKDAGSMAREQAATYRSYGWAGVRPGDAQARFWGVPLKAKDARKNAVRDALLNRKRYSAFNYTPASFPGYMDALRAQGPDYIYGYPSILAEIGHWLRQDPARAGSPGKGPVPTLRAIITTAEILTPTMREAIEQGFATRVFDEYGCAEVGSIAHDCEHGSLHVNSENLLVEILTDEGEIRSEGTGRLVLTELHNRAQPLIRYDSGDYGELSFAPCACGRALPVLENVHGRAYDTVIGPEGRRYNAAFFSYIFKEVQLRGEMVRQFQVIQNDREITFRIVRGADYDSSSEALLARLLADEFGDYFEPRFEYPDSIERESSGKLRQLKRVSPPDPVSQVLDSP
ncbi:MAG: phenylacetate--CoA ligase family protein [Gemmatimonadetes bacterium]|nr:phenylacetate--CoA ligase family protein [Gemmatimonadota bacterium]